MHLGPAVSGLGGTDHYRRRDQGQDLLGMRGNGVREQESDDHVVWLALLVAAVIDMGWEYAAGEEQNSPSCNYAVHGTASASP